MKPEQALSVCLPPELLRLQSSDLETFFFTILFPWLCAIGLVGNCMNLTVLLSSEVRNQRFTRRSNSLLVALAVCDILFLLLILPHTLAQFDQFGQLPDFRLLYLSLRVHLVAFANWCSAVAIWLIIAICADRLLGIHRLWRGGERNRWFSWFSTVQLIVVIVAIAGILTSYNHFSYHCFVKYLCHHQQVISKCFSVLQEEWPANVTNSTPHQMREYVRWSMVANVVLVILVPIVIILILNVALLVVVRRQSFIMYTRLAKSSQSSAGSGRNGGGQNGGGDPQKPQQTTTKQQNPYRDHRRCSAPAYPAVVVQQPTPTANKQQNGGANGGGGEGNGALVTVQQKQLMKLRIRRSLDQQFQAEHHVTVTVCAIVTCFTLTQGPSAIVLFMSFLSSDGNTVPRHHSSANGQSEAFWHHINSLTGFLVIFGKTLNFILFCLSSGTFRRRLATILRRKLRFLLPENWRRSASGKSQVASSANSSLRQRHAIAIGGAATPVPAKHHQINNNPAVFLANKDRKFSLADF